MSKISWGEQGKRFFETGVSSGVLYLPDSPGVPWNGLVSVNQKPEGGSVESHYFDGIKYGMTIDYDDFQATLEAYTYPLEFEECNGTLDLFPGISADNQVGTPFGLSYKTNIGNDLDGINHGYKIHLVYNARVAPPDSSFQTVDNQPSPSNFQWDIYAIPVEAPGLKPTAHYTFDSRRVQPLLLKKFEDILYGTETTDPRLPDIEEIIEISTDWEKIEIVDHGDGTWSAIGPQELVYFENEEGLFRVDDVNATYLDGDTYEVSTTQL